MYRRRLSVQITQPEERKKDSFISAHRIALTLMFTSARSNIITENAMRVCEQQELL